MNVLKNVSREEHHEGFFTDDHAGGVVIGEVRVEREAKLGP
jgi:hypothetical protein